jgi:hypothetical protein
MTFFNELITLNGIDPKLEKLVHKNIKDYFDNSFTDREFNEKSKVLSSSVVIQIERQLYKNFISNVELFDKLDILTIRILK